MFNKILVIDDNLIFCNAIKYHLSQNKYNVAICISYSELQNKIDIKEYDLILLDLSLKDANGLDVLEDILKSNPEKMVIIVSSYLDNVNILKAKKLGAYKCLNKNSRLFDELDILIEEIYDKQ